MFEIEDRQVALVATAPSQLDSSVSREARAALLESISTSRPRLVVDLSALGFIDSSGLGVLVAALKTARSAGGDVRLCGLAPTVRSIFDVTRLSRKFRIFESTGEALASFAGESPRP